MKEQKNTKLFSSTRLEQNRFEGRETSPSRREREPSPDRRLRNETRRERPAARARRAKTTTPQKKKKKRGGVPPPSLLTSLVLLHFFVRLRSLFSGEAFVEFPLRLPPCSSTPGPFICAQVRSSRLHFGPRGVEMRQRGARRGPPSCSLPTSNPPSSTWAKRKKKLAFPLFLRVPPSPPPFSLRLPSHPLVSLLRLSPQSPR